MDRCTGSRLWHYAKVMKHDVIPVALRIML